MQRAIIIARGEVQRVGYRDVVERTARDRGLTGFVENIKPYDVKIVCEGEKTSIDSFIKLINIKMFPIAVKELDVSFEDATGEFDYFEIKRGDMVEELGERLDLARAEMTKMVGKQDVMINTLEDFKHETNDNFNQLTYAITKHDLDAQERIASLSAEVSEVKVRLTRLESAVL